MTDKIEHVETKKLTIHPLANRLPMLTPDNPQFCELVNGVSEGGVLQPLIVDQENRVIAGRHRLEAARANSQETVPVLRVQADDAEAAHIVIKENMERQEMSQSKRALMVVALHSEFFSGRKDRRGGDRKTKVYRVDFDPDSIPENPFRGEKTSLIHAKKWKDMPLTVKQLAQRYGVAYQFLVWAAHLWDDREGEAKPYIQSVWDGKASLGAAYAGFMGGKAPQKRRTPEEKMEDFVGETRDRVKSMFKIQREAPDTFVKYHDDLLKLFNDLRVLLDIPREKPGRHING